MFVLIRVFLYLFAVLFPHFIPEPFIRLALFFLFSNRIFQPDKLFYLFVREWH